jgi:hypothetical protein
MNEEQQLKVKLLDIPDDPLKIKLTVPEDDKIVIPLKVRKNLNGTIFLCDHPFIDIVVDPNKRKISTFSKTDKKKDTYSIQKNLFDFLVNVGLLSQDAIKGGSIYGSLECSYPDNKEVDALASIMIGLYKFIAEDNKATMSSREYEEKIEDLYTDPDEDETTSFEKAASTHRDRKGSIDPNAKPYGLVYRI